MGKDKEQYYIDDECEDILIRKRNDSHELEILKPDLPWWRKADPDGSYMREYYLGQGNNVLSEIQAQDAANIVSGWGMDLMMIPDEGTVLEQAVEFAIKCHHGQTRKGTDIPYIVHPLEVMTIIEAMHQSTEVIIAGVLHDTLEDTDATIKDIKDNFGDRVADLVACHTEDKSKTWEERKEAAIEEIKNGSYELKCIILADKLSNMRALARDHRELGDKVFERFNRPKEKQSWFYSECIDAFEGMQHILETKEFYWELNELYKDVFVDFYYDVENRTFWQIAAHGETAYFQIDDPHWKDYKDNKLDLDAYKVDRRYVERMEDNWVEEAERRKREEDERRQLTKEDIYKASRIHLYNDIDIYVEMPGVSDYYTYNRSVARWELSDKMDEYLDSSLMMSYLRMISPEEAIELLTSWGAFKE